MHKYIHTESTLYVYIYVYIYITYDLKIYTYVPIYIYIDIYTWHIYTCTRTYTYTYIMYHKSICIWTIVVLEACAGFSEVPTHTHKNYYAPARAD